ncbi:MAG: hypothetical protein ABSH06_28970 [Thermodesulfobacteriota bacterium]|jgi:hypothetical protein
MTTELERRSRAGKKGWQTFLRHQAQRDEESKKFFEIVRKREAQRIKKRRQARENRKRRNRKLDAILEARERGERGLADALTSEERKALIQRARLRRTAEVRRLWRNQLARERRRERRLREHPEATPAPVSQGESVQDPTVSEPSAPLPRRVIR